MYLEVHFAVVIYFSVTGIMFFMIEDCTLFSRDPDVLEQRSFPVCLSSLVFPESGYIIGKLHLAVSKYLADCGAKKPHTFTIYVHDIPKT